MVSSAPVLGLSLMELSNLILEVIDLKLIKHYHLVVPVFPEQALEADRAKAILAKSLDVLLPVDFAFGQVLISVRNYLGLVLLLHHLLLLSNTKLHIVSIVGVLTRGHILGVALDAH